MMGTELEALITGKIEGREVGTRLRITAGYDRLFCIHFNLGKTMQELAGVPLQTLAGLLAFGFVVAGLIHISGVGAGVLLVPSLMVVFHLSPTGAVATASLFSVLFRVGSVMSIWKSGNLVWSAFRRFVLFALPVAAVSAALAGFIHKFAPEAKPVIDSVVRALVVIACLIALTSLYSDKLKAAMRKLGMGGLASISGFFIGASGVGGGVLVVPALLSLGTLTASQSVATSGIISMVLMSSSSLLYAISGAVAWVYLICMLVGGYASLPFAIKLQKRLSQKTLVDIVAALIVVSLNGLLIQWLF
jgi:uncharacterized protein